MLSTLFYLIGLFIFLLNIIIFSNFSKYLYVVEFVNKFKKVTGKNPQQSDLSNEQHQIYAFILCVDSFSFLWFFVGLISSSWIVFLIYLMIQPLFNLIIKNTKIKFLYNLVSFLRILTNVSIIALLVFNHFHLHLDLNSFILH